MEHRVESVKDALLYLVAEGERVGGVVNVADFGLAVGIRAGDGIMIAAQANNRQVIPMSHLRLTKPVPPGRYWLALVMLPMKDTDQIIVTSKMPNGG